MSRGSIYKTISDLQSKESEEKPIKSVVIDIITTDHKQTAIQVKPICISYIYGDYCTPCQSVSPKYDILANSMVDDKCIFIKENVDLGLSRDIQVIPAFQVYYLGKKVKTVYGSPMEELKDLITRMKLNLTNDSANLQFQ